MAAATGRLPMRSPAARSASAIAAPARAGAAGLVFQRLASLEEAGIVHLLAALLAGLASVAGNLGLLCFAMALSEALWRERFHLRLTRRPAGAA